MKTTISTYFMTLVTLMAFLGLALLLTGCGAAAGSGTGSGSDSANSKARDEFLAERGAGATPGVVTGTLAPRAGSSGVDLDRRGVIGTVTEINGNKVVVDSPMDHVQTTITVKGDARIVRQAGAKASDIKKGDTITVSGKKNGDTLDAELVQIGDTGAADGLMLGGFVVEDKSGAPGAPSAPGAPGGSGGPGGQGWVINPAPPGSAPPNGDKPVTITPGPGQDMIAANLQMSTGTVQDVSDGNITLRTKEGESLTVRLGSGAHVFKQEQAKLADVKTGDTVMASGEDKGQEFEADFVQIMGKP